MAAEVPLYDGTAKYPDPATVVRLEMFCACGLMHRQVDPVSYLDAAVESFRAAHTGPGHGPVSAKAALAEREARRKAALRAAGRHGDYQAKHHPELGSNPDHWDWSTRPNEGRG